MADGLVDMKRPKSDDKAGEMALPADEGGQYPYGLCLHLNDEELKKLGIKELPRVGVEFHLMAVAMVTGVSESASEKHQDRNVSLQITMMQVMEEAPHKGEEKETPAAEMREFKGATTVLGNAYK